MAQRSETRHRNAAIEAPSSQDRDPIEGCAEHNIRRQQLLALQRMTTTEKPKPLPIRVDRDQIDRIDRLRGLVPRERYVRDLMDKALKAQERKAARR